MPDISLSCGNYRAEVRTDGAGLNFLTFKGRHLVDPFIEGEDYRFRGDVLAPWPNRLRDGKYEVDGELFVAAINEPGRGTALHGLINHLEWGVTSRTDSTVELEVDLSASSAYPTSLHFKAIYKLTDDGLSISISAKNTGDKKSPYGVSIHPYLVAESKSKVDAWTLDMNASKVLEVDAERLLPIALRDVTDMNYDFRQGAVIGERFIDHAFNVNESAPRIVKILGADGSGVAMEFDDTSKWIQIHTADREGGDDSRICLAVEPMTCPPDAFNSGTDVIWLAAGDETSSWWAISAVGE